MLWLMCAEVADPGTAREPRRAGAVLAVPQRAQRAKRQTRYYRH